MSQPESTMDSPIMTSPAFRGMIASACFHATLLVVLSLIMFQAREMPESQPLTTLWTGPELPQEPVAALVSMPEPDSLDPVSRDNTKIDQGGSAEALLAEEEMSQSQEVILETDPLRILDATPLSTGAKSSRSRVAKVTGKNRTGGNGNGKGVGKGSGQGTGGKGIFSSSQAARKVVYVVDCSLSMNAPHRASYYRTGVPTTRFQRVQLELVQTVETLPEETEFAIIFFSDREFTLPGQSMVLATRENKLKVLQWLATSMTMSGGTDPREALTLALKLEPQVIYLLTDGSFHPTIQQDLLKLKQDQTIVHTIAFGEATAEPILKQISEQNRGEFSYVP